MADEKMNEKEGPPKAVEGSPKFKKGNKVILILILGLFLMVAAGGVLFLMPSLLPFKGKKAEEAGQDRSGSFSKGHLYSLESMIVNLADADVPRYLKVKIDLESASSKPQEEFEKRLPQLKDLLLNILTSKTYQEISDAAGKTKLKEEILERSNRLFNTVKIKTVYFTEFVVQ